MAYVSDKRVVRSGRLVAFKGESMTEAEAKRRGLIGAPKPAKPAKKAKAAEKPADKPKEAEKAPDAKAAEKPAE